MKVWEKGREGREAKPSCSPSYMCKERFTSFNKILTTTCLQKISNIPQSTSKLKSKDSTGKVRLRCTLPSPRNLHQHCKRLLLFYSQTTPGSHVSTALGIIICSAEARTPMPLTVVIKKQEYTVQRTSESCYLYDLPKF